MKMKVPRMDYVIFLKALLFFIPYSLMIRVLFIVLYYDIIIPHILPCKCSKSVLQGRIDIVSLSVLGLDLSSYSISLIPTC